MKLILQECMRNEIIARQRYFYETFHLWLVISANEPSYSELVSIPAHSLDILFIAGHNSFVKNLLQQHEIQEKRIAAITCDGTVHVSELKLPDKIFYIARQNKWGYADQFRGEHFGFDFDITESELLLYQTNKADKLSKRLEDSFYRL